MNQWSPKISVPECDRIITAPGQPLEVEKAIINGIVLRVYKNLPNSLRRFWLDRPQEHQNRDYLVYENERYTYAQAADRAFKLASLMYTKYGVRKGDRVAILMRNLPEYMIIFWAIHLLGAVATLINAWAPPPTLKHCISMTDPKVIIVDPERADRLSGSLLSELRLKTNIIKVFVVRGHNPTGAPMRWKWKDISSLETALATFEASGLPTDSWKACPEPSPEDDATIFFTSGTTGLPKGVLSSQRSFLTNLMNSSSSRLRTLLRRGEELPVTNVNDPQKAVLLSVPLFHVTGLTSFAMISTALGAKIVLIRKWNKDEAARLIVREGITNAGGVPSMVMDLLDSDLASNTLEALSYGGAPSAETMPKDVHVRFPKVESAQGYGLSETNAVAAGIHGEDYLARPASTGCATPVNDLLVVDPNTQRILGPNQVGELWIKGPNVIKGYWRDPVATAKAITKDGWFKTGDIASMDEEGFVYIKDRVKDIIIRGGENIHSTEVENALYSDDRILDAAAVSVPDKRLGELVAAVVTTKSHFHGQVTEADVIKRAREHLPAHAVPVMVLVQDEMIERNANGKIMKDVLRTRVRKEWARRLGLRSTAIPLTTTTNATASTSKKAIRAKL
ncbi:long-chain-fatty-acid- ligase [Pyrrhoderma noxium]|uniref:Long-chain-fatty-acid-ligase n=1 Tax=Pyrrhoderma noxium TaxID=2282107 RepID=A0A286U645_9AGAM|nr:long-chain-fatty-acid- ligase [Pyrrhoderma noxium]